jgi:hypothetical protein
MMIEIYTETCRFLSKNRNCILLFNVILNIAFTLDKRQFGGPSPNIIKSLGVLSIFHLKQD